MLIIILILVDPEYCRGKRTQPTSDLQLRINLEGRLPPRYENFKFYLLPFPREFLRWQFAEF